ncbi:MAG TPA: PilZ domain-containing protein [Polyangia bacterium]|nr:PilZ domain-containing protein [Polyangia bacterium]
MRIEIEASDLTIEGTIFAVDAERVAIRFRDQALPLLPRLPLDTPVAMKIWDRYGMNRAETTVHAIIEDGGSGAIILGAPSGFVGTQTRRFFRVAARLELTLERVVAEAAQSRPERALSCDVSAGGVAFFSDISFEIDDRVSVTMILPREVAGLSGEPQKFEARVVRSESSDQSGRRFFGVEFQNVTARQRDRMVETMLGLQRIIR